MQSSCRHLERVRTEGHRKGERADGGVFEMLFVSVGRSIEKQRKTCCEIGGAKSLIRTSESYSDMDSPARCKAHAPIGDRGDSNCLLAWLLFCMMPQ